MRFGKYQYTGFIKLAHNLKEGIKVLFSRKAKTMGFVLLMGLILVSCASSPKVETTMASEAVTEGISEADVADDMTESAAPDQVIIIKDENLEQMIRKQIEKPEGDITVGDMEMVYSISINFEETPVYEIDGLEHAVNLNDFSFRNGTLKSLNPVSKLKYMGYLGISYASIEEPILPFETPVLDRIGFIDTNISDFDFLNGVTSAKDVSFVNSEIASIEFMRDWDALEELNLSDNLVSDVSPLEGKTNLRYLSLHKNKVESIDVFSSLTALETLNISYNNVSNIEPIMQLQYLTEFTAYEELDKKIIDRGLLETLEGKGVLVEYHE